MSSIKPCMPASETMLCSAATARLYSCPLPVSPSDTNGFVQVMAAMASDDTLRSGLAQRLEAGRARHAASHPRNLQTTSGGAMMSDLTEVHILPRGKNRQRCDVERVCTVEEGA